jgi:hypothetical protein
MRALTVRQPWAWAIIHGDKRIENRNWKNRYTIGRIAIHAGLGDDGFDNYPKRKKRPQRHQLVYGAIIGVVEIVDVVTTHQSVWFEGKYGWVLRNPRPLRKSIKCKGKLGLWELSTKHANQFSSELRST